MNEKIGSPIVTKVDVSTAGLYNTSKRLIMRPGFPRPRTENISQKLFPRVIMVRPYLPHRTGATMYYTTLFTVSTWASLNQSPPEFFIYQKICWKYKTNLPSTTTKSKKNKNYT